MSDAESALVLSLLMFLTAMQAKRSITGLSGILASIALAVSALIWCVLAIYRGI